MKVTSSAMTLGDDDGDNDYIMASCGSLLDPVCWVMATRSTPARTNQCVSQPAMDQADRRRGEAKAMRSVMTATAPDRRVPERLWWLPAMGWCAGVKSVMTATRSHGRMPERLLERIVRSSPHRPATRRRRVRGV